MAIEIGQESVVIFISIMFKRHSQLDGVADRFSISGVLFTRQLEVGSLLGIVRSGDDGLLLDSLFLYLSSQ